jgi:alpha-galactosidase
VFRPSHLLLCNESLAGKAISESWVTRLAMLMDMVNTKRLLVVAAICGFASLAFLRIGKAALNYTSFTMNSAATENTPDQFIAFAERLSEPVDSEGFPSKTAWDTAAPLHFDHDWQGKNPDSQRATEVRLLWTPDTLFLRFHCQYRSITVFPDARVDGWRNKLWDRDVAETFLQSDSTDPLIYKEFEVSPNGYWIDLAVSHGKIEELSSGLKRRVTINEKSRTWTAELAIPMHRLTTRFDPQQPWRVNFFRIEGANEPRFYAAWSPTNTPKPNFHVPSAFGQLVFRE